MTHDHVAPQPFNGFALGSAVLGNLSLLAAWIPILNLAVIVPAAVGLTFGVLGLRRSGGRGMAISGIVASSASLILVVVALGLFAVVVFRLRPA
ncbi:hypothetical protein [Caulobacter mirabilis]|uniref:DUF4190 domain-containing protein n=1 Tax=Caulobacter mirabilis TaxID=69666 RepID=A0A2D2AVW0_9CAUL|nr:hypothetical protein [Caulobacter mirabilis]ATQ42140.1 hypothetical protein CSW64_06780 [Caulobacter mirabilis]